MSTKYEINNSEFSEKPVHQFLDGKHHFLIPSYQRGYRWDLKQVDDMLEDLCQFANDGNPQNNKYFLQPIVVKRTGDYWEVLDGQQRLTTMLIILKVFLNGQYMIPATTEAFLPLLYTIHYRNRPDLNFDNPNFTDNIDSYYLSNAKNKIEEWMKKKATNEDTLNAIKNCLFSDKQNIKKAYFIWYPVPEKSDDESSIKIFNRLNKGKIPLTSSELIKALFIRDCNHKNTDEAKQQEEQLSMEWAEIERQFQDDNFWYFISNNKEEQTRIDLLFDFVTCKNKESDSDYSYRMFQNLYDYNLNNDSTELNSLWNEKRIKAKLQSYTMKNAWDAVKETYNRLLAWYESNLYYHYIGFLITRNKIPLDIYNQLVADKKKALEKNPDKEWTEDDIKQSLRLMIRKEFISKNQLLEASDIDEIEYDSDFPRRLLLLFNVETCIITENQRFDFAKFKKESWDVEHIDSQNEATIQEFEDRITWMKNVDQCLKKEIKAHTPESEEAKALEKKCSELIHHFTELKRVEQESYSEFYKEIHTHFSSSCGVESNKDLISNLTLLNSSTNREYKDAPFMYKREVIIKKDKEGKCFLPICTRNCFLKYYTDDENDISQLDAMRWNKTDKACYLKALHTTLDPIFSTTKEDDK